MSLKEQMLADRRIFYNGDDFCETILYNTQTTSAEILAFVDREENIAKTIGDGQAILATLYVQKADVESPSYKDSVVFDGFTWTVIKIELGSDIDWRINVLRGSRTNFSRT